MATNGDNPFELGAERYDAWFDTPEGKVLFQNEVAALRSLWRGKRDPALEIGVGTGRFAQALGVGTGIDPAPAMLARARARGVGIVPGRGEELPFPAGGFQAILLVTVLGFAQDPARVVAEAARVLRPGGFLVVGEIPAGTAWGRRCQERKDSGNPFYRDIRLFTVHELVALLGRAGFGVAGYASTLIDSVPGAPRPEPVRPGLVSDAGFVAVRVRPTGLPAGGKGSAGR